MSTDLEQPDAAPVDDAPFSMEDAMAEAFDNVAAENDDAAPADRRRDESGRFVSATQNSSEDDEVGEPDPSDASVDEPTDDSQTDPQSTADNGTEDHGTGNPHGWKPEELDVLNQLPKETQDMITGRLTAMQALGTRKAQEIGEIGQMGQVLHDNVFGPRMQDLQAAGVNPIQRTAELWQYADAMANDPVNTINRLMQETGTSVEALAKAAGYLLASEDDGGYMPPAETPLDSNNPQIQAIIKPLQDRLDAIDAAGHQDAVKANETIIEQFAGEKDGEGNSLRPHFNDVYDDVVANVLALNQTHPQMTQTDKLDRAYKMAVALNPDVQKRMEVARAAADAQSKDKIAKAKKKGGRNVTTEGLSKPAPIIQGKTMKDTMANVYDEVQDR